MPRPVTSSLTHGHAGDLAPTDHPSPPPGHGVGAASQPAACLWDSLPNDTLAGIASYLSLTDRTRLSEADRRTRHALLPQLNPVRLEWMISRVSNASTFRAALAEIGRQRLRPADRARALGALFDSMISRVQGGSTDILWFELLDAVTGLPVSTRGRLLRRMIETARPWPPGWRNRPHSTDPDMANARLRYDSTLWSLIRVQPAAEQVLLLVVAIDSMERDDFVGVDLDQWIARAIALPDGHQAMTEEPGESITYRGKVLQALLRGAEEVGAVRHEAGFRRFMEVSERLRMPDGSPSTQERSELLVDLASVLVRCSRLRHDDSGRIWDDLLDAACRLPPEGAAPAMLSLANWFAVADHSGDVVRAQRLWKLAREMFRDDIVLRSQWLATLGSYIPDRSEVWQTLWREWRASARPDKHKAAIMLGLAAVQLPPLPDSTPAWWAVLNATATLPPEHRGEVLVGLAQGLRDSEADPYDPRWNAVVDAGASLPAAAKLSLLTECIEHDPALLRCHWPRYAEQLAALPRDELGEALPFALYLAREFDHDDAERAWWAVAAQLYRTPAQALGEPWRVLFRLIHSLYYGEDEDEDEDGEQLAQVREFLQGPLRSMAPIDQRDLLIAAISDLQAPEYAAHFRWFLDQADSLPSALRAPLLAEMAWPAPAGTSVNELVPIWDALVGATAALPVGYRGSPITSLAQLYKCLPRGHHEAALRALLALCAGVPVVDLPPELMPLPHAMGPWQT